MKPYFVWVPGRMPEGATRVPRLFSVALPTSSTMRRLLALSFSLAAAQPALRGASEGTRALLFSNFVDSSVETVAPTAAQTTSAGSCQSTESDGEREFDVYVCDVPADLCIDPAYPDNIWYPPGYTAIEDEQDTDNEGCCHCDADCDHDAETGDDCASKYYMEYCSLIGSC